MSPTTRILMVIATLALLATACSVPINDVLVPVDGAAEVAEAGDGRSDTAGQDAAGQADEDRAFTFDFDENGQLDLDQLFDNDLFGENSPFTFGDDGSFQFNFEFDENGQLDLDQLFDNGLFGENSPFTFGDDGSFQFNFEFDGNGLGLTPGEGGPDLEEFFGLFDDGELTDEELQELFESLFGLDG